MITMPDCYPLAHENEKRGRGDGLLRTQVLGDRYHGPAVSADDEKPATIRDPGGPLPYLLAGVGRVSSRRLFGGCWVGWGFTCSKYPWDMEISFGPRLPRINGSSA